MNTSTGTQNKYTQEYYMYKSRSGTIFSCREQSGNEAI